MPKRQSVVEDRRLSIAEARYPTTSEFLKLSKVWSCDASNSFLRLIWNAYDCLIKEVLLQVDVAQSDADLERSLTQLLEPRIRRLMSGDEPFYVQHGTYEHEIRAVPPAQPPQYDIAFVMNHNPRIMWPMEAKVLRTDSAVAPYIRELKTNYLTCRYAPFSREAAMLGYLCSGDPDKVMWQLTKKIPCKLVHPRNFRDRPHKYSLHSRAVPRGKNYHARFKCHHMIMEIAVKRTSEA